MKKLKRNKIIAGIITFGLVISPLTVEARGGGHAGGHASSHSSSHVSSHSSSHTSSSHSISRSTSSFKSNSSVKSSSSVKTSTPKTSKSTSKVTTKSVTKSTKPSSKPTTNKVDSSNKFSTKAKTNTSKVKSNTKTTTKSTTNKSNITKKTTVRKVTINKNYKVRPKTTTRVVVSHPTRYVHYSSTPIYVNRGASFWDYYLLSNLISSNNNHQVTERDIAQNLEQQGYSKSEVDQILKDAQTENKKIKKESFFKKLLNGVWFVFKSVILISALVIVIMWLKKRFK